MPAEVVRIVIPFRGPGSGKTRLAAILDANERAALSLAMMRRVVTVARSAVPDVVVVSADSALRKTVSLMGAQLEIQRGCGMNDALEQARATAIGDGISVLAVLSADLPRISVDDIHGLLSAGHSHGSRSLTIAPDRSGSGTNALVLRPLDVIHRFEFGYESRVRHHSSASRANASVILTERPGLAHDIDTAVDLAAWIGGSEARRELAGPVQA